MKLQRSYRLASNSKDSVCASGWAERRARGKTRGGYRVMKLMRLKEKGGGITLSFTSRHCFL